MSPGEARTSKTLEEEQLFKIEETIHHHPSPSISHVQNWNDA
jgi:hypothetical protein